MACENIVGVKNIILSFYDCDTDTRIGPISHTQADEDLPTWRLCNFTNERMVDGYIKRNRSNAGVTIKVIRDLRIPLAWYQGCAAIDLQVEYDNGLVYTGLNGGTIGDASSDSHTVEMDLSFKTLDELMPTGALAQAA